MNRRDLLRLILLAAGATIAGGHTPYGQWVVYRKKHLLIGCHRTDPPTYDLAKQVVVLLGEHLPAAKSRVARAPDAGRLASLLGTAQMDVAILSHADAAAMAKGADRFKAYGAVPLRLLTPVDDRLLVARADFPARHAWLVAGALAGSELAPASQPPAETAIPWHPGSLAFQRGEPQPAEE